MCQHNGASPASLLLWLLGVAGRGRALDVGGRVGPTGGRTGLGGRLWPRTGMVTAGGRWRSGARQDTWQAACPTSQAVRPTSQAACPTWQEKCARAHFPLDLWPQTPHILPTTKD